MAAPSENPHTYMYIGWDGWTGLIWLRIGTVDGSCEHGNIPSVSLTHLKYLSSYTTGSFCPIFRNCPLLHFSTSIAGIGRFCTFTGSIWAHQRWPHMQGLGGFRAPNIRTSGMLDGHTKGPQGCWMAAHKDIRDVGWSHIRTSGMLDGST
jgi:hypothetical protein